MYSRGKLGKAVTVTLTLALVLATTTLIAPKVMGNGAGIPPPPVNGANTNAPAQTPSNGGRGSNAVSEMPPPLNTGTSSSNAEAPQPPPPPVPSTAALKDEALRELWYAYREYNATLDLINYAAKNGVQANSDTQYFKALAEDLYSKALTAYSNANYVVAKSYARLSIESMHSLRDIVTYELSIKGIAPPPPAGPPVPP